MALDYIPKQMDGFYHFYIHKNTPQEYLLMEGVMPFLRDLVHNKVLYKVF